MSTGKWERLVAEARQNRDETIAQIEPPIPDLSDLTDPTLPLPRNVTRIPRSVLSASEVIITETPVEELLAQLASGSLTAVDATKAFLRRAGIAQKLVNCVFEVLPGEALQRAKELDAFYKTHQRVVGPLYGLPISLKAMLPWQGRKATGGGIVANLETVTDKDASPVAILRSLGAIPYVHTTEPQGVSVAYCLWGANIRKASVSSHNANVYIVPLPDRLLFKWNFLTQQDQMMLENLSPIHGSTLNPHNTHLTPGGSTGGESALMGMLASPLGLGTDIGGSVRQPAANCGIYALRPSCYRIPNAGIKNFFNGMDTIHGTPGPMSPSRHGISAFMKAVLDTQPWGRDTTVLPIPWRTVELPKTLNIGVMWDDGIVKPSRAMTRALKEVVAKLKENPRFNVTEWKPLKHDEAMDILTKLYSPDKGESFVKMTSKTGEPIHEIIDYTLINGPGVEHQSHEQVRRWTMARNSLRIEYLQEWLRVAPDMHAILCPPHPGAAQPIGTTRYWGYTSMWNLLDCPAVVFPVIKVDAELDSETGGYTARNEMDAWTHRFFDAAEQAGAPLGLQLVGKRLEDETVVEIMNEIVEAVGLPFHDCLRQQ